MAWGTVELEPEVRDWLEGLPTVLFARAAFNIELLAERGPLLGEPYTRQLDGKLRELRFYLDRDAVRVTYWIAADKRIILLTVFVKTRMREERQIERARRALARCIAKAHTVEEVQRWASEPTGASCGSDGWPNPVRTRRTPRRDWRSNWVVPCAS